jgi:hypothetical protein
MGALALQLSPVQRYLDRLYGELLGMTGGEVASDIPELTRANPSSLGIAIVTVEGHVYQVGDSRQYSWDNSAWACARRPSTSRATACAASRPTRGSRRDRPTARSRSTAVVLH